ncbi:hypothetical protein [Streptomyces mayteni]
MRDPASSPEPSSSEDAGDGLEEVQQAVVQVIAWYTQEILAERRRPTPDEARIERLTVEQQACLADRDALEDGDDQEVARLAAIYAARLKALGEE